MQIDITHFYFCSGNDAIRVTHLHPKWSWTSPTGVVYSVVDGHLSPTPMFVNGIPMDPSSKVELPVKCLHGHRPNHYEYSGGTFLMNSMLAQEMFCSPWSDIVLTSYKHVFKYRDIALEGCMRIVDVENPLGDSCLESESIVHFVMEELWGDSRLRLMAWKVLENRICGRVPLINALLNLEKDAKV